jgi:hypothetical protein
VRAQTDLDEAHLLEVVVEGVGLRVEPDGRAVVRVEPR